MSTQAKADQFVENSSLESNTQVKTPLMRRSHLEIFCDILRAIGSGADRPSTIMFKADLSWEVLQSYLRTLQSQNLIEASESDAKRTYRLSQKGYDILKQFVSIRKDME
jgi:predicted transcriptional regulator